jgi:hypothetical protein
MKCHSERSEGSRTSDHRMNTSFKEHTMCRFKSGCHLSCQLGCHFLSNDYALYKKKMRRGGFRGEGERLYKLCGAVYFRKSQKV